MRKQIKHWVGAAALAVCSLGAAAQSAYSDLFVFGDSLSDTGNVFIATGGFVPAAPYFAGRFSNGPVWVDYLALDLGLPLGAAPVLQQSANPMLPAGHNYAFGGARTGSGTTPVPGVLAQVGGMYLPSVGNMADANALYVVVGGGNDMRDARNANGGLTAADDLDRQAAADLAAGQLSTSLQALYGAGARNFLVANLPDLGRTPEAVGLGLEAASTDATNRYNSALGLELNNLSALPGINLMFVDFNLGANLINSAPAAFGITNSTEPCAGFTGAVNNISCDVSAFSDDLHPSALVHGVFGLMAIQAVTAVPEPQTLLLLAAGLLLVVARTRRNA